MYIDDDDEENENDDVEIEGEDAEYYFNKGEQDASEGIYDPPEKRIISSRNEYEEECRRRYFDGWYYTKGQQDANDGKYNPPTLDDDDREKYDEGYESVKNNS